MVRSLVLAAVVVTAACSKQDEPPPDPHGACAKSSKAFDRVDAAFAALARRAPNVDGTTDAYCTRLQTAASASALATVGNKALGSIAAGLAQIASKCPHQPVEVTEQAIAEQLGKGRAVIDKMCSPRK
jgi:hypothetical protein